MKRIPQMFSLAKQLLAACTLMSTMAVLFQRCNGCSSDNDDGPKSADNTIALMREQMKGTAIGSFTDDEMNSFEKDVPVAYTGWSKAFSKEPVEGVRISAPSGAFEKDTDVRFYAVSDEEFDDINRKLEQAGDNAATLFMYHVDAGLGDEGRSPGNYRVEFDLRTMDIPETLWKDLAIRRITEQGGVALWTSRLEDGKLIYEADCNSIWELTIPGGTPLFGLLAAAGGSYLFRNYKVCNKFGWFQYFRKNSQYNFCQTIQDDFGTFNVCFDIRDTECADPDAFVEGNQRAEKRLEELKIQAEKDYQKQFEKEKQTKKMTQMEWMDKWAKSRKQQQVAIQTLTKEQIYANLIDKDTMLIRLVRDSIITLPPSVASIIEMVKVSNRYLGSVQKLKKPWRACDIYLVDGALTKNQPALFVPIDLQKPYVFINYKDYFVVKNPDTGKRELNKSEEVCADKIFVSLCHEMFHRYQMAYVLSSLTRDMRYFEATAALLEVEFATWLYDQKKTAVDPASDGGPSYYGFTSRQEKEWLAFTLKKTIKGHSKDLKITEEELRLRREKYQAEAKKYKWWDVAELLPIQAEYFLEGTNIIFEGIGDANVDCGYMLGDFLDFLRERTSTTKDDGEDFVSLHKLLSAYSLWNGFDGAVQEAFNLPPEQMQTLYEYFCAKYMSPIIARQTDAYNSDKGKKFFNNIFLPEVTMEETNCVYTFSPFAQAGPYSCRTMTFSNKQSFRKRRFNLFIIPSAAVDMNLVQVRLLRQDKDTFATKRQFTECVSKSDKNPVVTYSAALFYRPGVEKVKFGNQHQLVAAAMYEPSEPVKVLGEMEGRKGLRVSTQCQPPQKLVDYGLVSGMEIAVKNNQTGGYHLLTVPLSSCGTTVAVPYTAIGVDNPDEVDITLASRWFFLPEPGMIDPQDRSTDPKNPVKFYSPESEPVRWKNQIAHKQEEEDNTDYAYSMKFKLKSCIGGVTKEIVKDAEKPIYGTFTVNRNGTFKIKVPSHSATHVGKGFKIIRSHSAVTVSGKCKIEKKGNQWEILTTWNDVSFSPDPVSSTTKYVYDNGETKMYEERYYYDDKVKGTNLDGSYLKLMDNFEDGDEDFGVPYRVKHWKSIDHQRGETVDHHDDSWHWITGEPQGNWKLMK